MSRRVKSGIAVLGALLLIGAVAGVAASAAGASSDQTQSAGVTAGPGLPGAFHDRKPVPGPSNAGPGMGMGGAYGMNGMPYGMGQRVDTSGVAPGDRTGMAIFREVTRIVEFLILIGVFIWVVRAVLAHLATRRTPTRQAARDELDLLYARGEIQRDDYLARRADLT